MISESLTVITTGHSFEDYHALLLAGHDDPDAVTQPRERPVPCADCGTGTWNIAGKCDSHYEPPRAADRALGGRGPR